MVGGKVSSIRTRQDRVRVIWVRGTGCERRDSRVVYTNSHLPIQPGASIWWQAQHLFVKNPGETNEVDVGRIRHMSEVGRG